MYDTLVIKDSEVVLLSITLLLDDEGLKKKLPVPVLYDMILKNRDVHFHA